MKTVEKRIYVSEMDFIEHTYLLGLLVKLRDESVIAIENKEDEAMIQKIIDGLKTN